MKRFGEIRIAISRRVSSIFITLLLKRISEIPTLIFQSDRVSFLYCSKARRGMLHHWVKNCDNHWWHILCSVITALPSLNEVSHRGEAASRLVTARRFSDNFAPF